MAHRVEVIVATIVAQLAAAMPAIAIVRGEPDPLPKDVDQRICVALGDDEPTDSGGHAFQDSRQTVVLALQARAKGGADAPRDAQQLAIDLRLDTHVHMRGAVRTALRALGWVHDVEYGGAEAAAGESARSTASTELRARWGVLYRSPHDNPSA